MGQARQRGTFEERKASALQAKEEIMKKHRAMEVERRTKLTPEEREAEDKKRSKIPAAIMMMARMAK